MLTESPSSHLVLAGLGLQPIPLQHMPLLLVSLITCCHLPQLEWKLLEGREPSQLPNSDRKQILQQLFVQ